MGQRVHNAGDQGGDDIHPGFQQYRKAGEDGFSDDRHNGGELLHEYVHQAGDALGEGFSGSGGAVQHTLQPLAHEGHEGNHGSKNIRRHGLQRGHDGFRDSAQLGVGIGKKCLGALGFHHITVEGFVVFRRFLVQAVEGIGNECGAFLLGTAAIQRRLEGFLIDAGPVQRVRQLAGDGAGLGGLIGGFGQTFDGKAVPEGGPYAGGDVRPLRQLFLGGAELGEVVDRLHAAVFFAQDGIETGVGFTSLFRRKSGGGEGCVQLGLVLPVFPCGLRQVEEALDQPGKGGPGGGNSGTRRDRQAFEDGANLLQLAGSLIGLVGCVIDLITELVRLLGGIPHLIAHGVDGPLVLVKLPLHVVQSGLGVVELDLPLLGAPVVLPERGGSVLQGLAQGLDFLLLGIDLLTQHLVPCGEGFHGIIVFVKLGLNDLHFRAEDFEGLVDVRQRLLEFLFALQPDFQAKVIRHPWSPPSKWHKKSPDFSRQKKRADCSTLSQELLLLTDAQLQEWLYS